MSECYAGEICREYDPDTRTPGLTERGPLCRPCLAAGERATTALVLDYRDLEQLQLPSLGQWGDGQPGHSGEAPIPLRMAPEALQRAIWWVTTTWAEIMTERARLADPPVRVRDGYAVAWAVRILAPRIPDLAEVGDVELADYPVADIDRAVHHRGVDLAVVNGAQAVLDLIRLRDRARSMLGLTALTRRLPGYCPAKRCGRPDLRQENGTDTVFCGSCGGVQTRDDYERYANVFLPGRGPT